MSIGCGNFLDYWSLVQSIEKKNLECEVRYVGIDEIAESICVRYEEENRLEL